MGGTGMNKPSSLEVDAYMGGGPTVAPVMEEDQVPFLKVLLADFPAVFRPLKFCVRL